MTKEPPEVAIIGFGQTTHVAADLDRDEAAMVQAATAAALADAGLRRSDVGFWCSGSCDYTLGKPFSFVTALEGAGLWPPVAESHVEGDAAWAVYEAWVHLLAGHADIAVVYGFGRASVCDIEEVLALQLDPYALQPLGVTQTALSAIQARQLYEAGRITGVEVEEVVRRSFAAARQNPAAVAFRERWGGDDTSGDVLLGAAQPYPPLRHRELPVWTDGAAAVVLARRDAAVLTGRDGAARSPPRTAWIAGMEHRIDPHGLGVRSLLDAPSVRGAAEALGVPGRVPDVVEVSAPTAPQELLVLECLGLKGAVARSRVVVNPSGGARCAWTPMVAGLVRIGEAAARVRDGTAGSALAHATSGPCLQHNLLCLLEGGP